MKLNMCITMGKRLRYFGTVVLNIKVLGLKCKNRLFFRKRGLSAVFMKLKCRWLHIGLLDLKNQTIEILHRVNVLRIF